jgi:hypothetical protein
VPSRDCRCLTENTLRVNAETDLPEYEGTPIKVVVVGTGGEALEDEGLLKNVDLEEEPVQ